MPSSSRPLKLWLLTVLTLAPPIIPCDPASKRQGGVSEEADEKASPRRGPPTHTHPQTPPPLSLFSAAFLFFWLGIEDGGPLCMCWGSRQPKGPVLALTRLGRIYSKVGRRFFGFASLLLSPALLLVSRLRPPYLNSRPGPALAGDYCSLAVP